jgi:hypothetical protein
MRTGYLSWAVFFILLCMFPASRSFAEDPGIPDTVRLGECHYNLGGLPVEGGLVLSLLLYNDEYLYGMDIPLEWSGPMVCDSARFVGERPEHFSAFGGTDLSIDHVIYLFGGALSGHDSIPPGEGSLAYLYFTLTDTGSVALDSIFLGGERYLHFVDVGLRTIHPHMVTFESPIVRPADANGDGAIDAGDVVSLINYLFRGGDIPDPLCRGDANGDAVVNPSDVVGLINCLFRAGPPPECSCQC